MKGISGRVVVRSLLTGIEGVLLLVACVGIAPPVVGVVVLKVLFFGEEILPGAGGDAVLRALTRDVGIFPPAAGGREEPVLESGWDGLDFFPENGAGAVLAVGAGLGVVAAFRERETLDFGVDVFLFDGGCGGLSFSFCDT